MRSKKSRKELDPYYNEELQHLLDSAEATVYGNKLQQRLQAKRVDSQKGPFAIESGLPSEIKPVTDGEISPIKQEENSSALQVYNPSKLQTQ